MQRLTISLYGGMDMETALRLLALELPKSGVTTYTIGDRTAYAYRRDYRRTPCVAVGFDAQSPGSRLFDLAQDRQMPYFDVAEYLGITAGELRRLYNGDLPITQELALAVSRVFGGTTAFWLERERLYREQLSGNSGELETPA